MAVVVADARDRRADGCLDAQLFVQLTGQRLLRAFARLDLAAGKLPLERHRLIRAALTDQNFAVAHNQRRRHEAQRGTGRPRISIGLDFFHASSVNAPKGLQSSSLHSPFGGMKNGFAAPAKELRFQKGPIRPLLPPRASRPSQAGSSPSRSWPPLRAAPETG